MLKTTVHSDTIVLIHGIVTPRIVMWPIAQRLRAEGFTVIPWYYPSLFQSIESHANRLHEFLSRELGQADRVHIVAHSMGSIVTRAALNRSSLSNLGRIVLLAPPNRGSPVARLASSLLGSKLPPTRELSDLPSSYVNQLAVNEACQIGVMAARYDFIVPANNTHIHGELDHQTLPASHVSLLFSATVVEKIARFLRTGRFEA